MHDLNRPHRRKRRHEVPEPEAMGLGIDLIARLDNHDRLDRMYLDRKLNRYRGEFVISDGETIFAHGRNLLKTRELGEKKAQARGIPLGVLVNYFVPRSLARSR